VDHRDGGTQATGNNVDINNVTSNRSGYRGEHGNSNVVLDVNKKQVERGTVYGDRTAALEMLGDKKQLSETISGGGLDAVQTDKEFDSKVSAFAAHISGALSPYLTQSGKEAEALVLQATVEAGVSTPQFSPIKAALKGQVARNYKNTAEYNRNLMTTAAKGLMEGARQDVLREVSGKGLNNDEIRQRINERQTAVVHNFKNSVTSWEASSYGLAAPAGAINAMAGKVSKANTNAAVPGGAGGSVWKNGGGNAHPMD